MRGRQKKLESRIASKAFDAAKRVFTQHLNPSKAVVAKLAADAMGTVVFSHDVTIIAFVEWQMAGRKPARLTSKDVFELHSAATSKARQAAKSESKKKKHGDAVGASKKLSVSTRAALGITRIGKPHQNYTDSNAFYASDAWKSIRYAILSRAGGRCMCCGSSAKDGTVLQVDHIVPRWKDPSRELDPDNLQVLCEPCNKGKGAWDQTDWRVK